jgi:hypothetical protein
MNAAEFQPALIAGDLDALRRCPKADLHNQFILSGDRAFLAERTGRDIAPLNAPLASMEEMHAWVAHATGGLFDSAAGRVLAFEAAFVQAARDGVTRLEVGEDVWAITLYGDSAARLTAVLEAVRRDWPHVAWIRQLGLSRHCTPAALDRWLDPFLALGNAPTPRSAPVKRVRKSVGVTSRCQPNPITAGPTDPARAFRRRRASRKASLRAKTVAPAAQSCAKSRSGTIRNDVCSAAPPRRNSSSVGNRLESAAARGSIHKR